MLFPEQLTKDERQPRKTKSLVFVTKEQKTKILRMPILSRFGQRPQNRLARVVHRTNYQRLKTISEKQKITVTRLTASPS